MAINRAVLSWEDNSPGMFNLSKSPLGGSRTKPVGTTGWWRLFITCFDPLQGAVGSSGPQQGPIDLEVLQSEQRLDLR